MHGDPVQGVDPSGLFVGSFGFSFGGLSGLSAGFLGVGQVAPALRTYAVAQQETVVLDGSFGNTNRIVLKLTGFNSGEKAVISKAVADAAKYSWEAYEYHFSNPGSDEGQRYFGATYYGSSTTAGIAKKHTIPLSSEASNHVKNDLHRLALSYDSTTGYTIHINNASGYSSFWDSVGYGVTAHVHQFRVPFTSIPIPIMQAPFSDPHIYLGEKFWKLKANAKAAVIVHEMTHEVNSTLDHGYMAYGGTGSNGINPSMSNIAPWYSPTGFAGMRAKVGLGPVGVYLDQHQLLRNASTYENFVKRVAVKNGNHYEW